MRIKVSTTDLKAALIGSLRIARKDTALPIRSHVMIRCEGLGARVTANDLTVVREQMIDYADDSRADWSCAVPARALKEVMPRTAKACQANPEVTLRLDGGYEPLPAGYVTKRVVDPNLTPPGNIVERRVFDVPEPTWTGELVVEIGEAETRLRTLPPRDFPAAPDPTADKFASEEQAVGEPAVVGGEDFREMIGRVYPAISTEKCRYQLAGALLELNGAARAVATDGHRLHRADAKVVVEGSESKAIVPRLAAQCVSTDKAFGKKSRPVPDGRYMLGKRKGERKYRVAVSFPDVYIQSSENHVWIESTRQVRYCARIPEGTFPDYAKVLLEGKKEECLIKADASEIAATLARVTHCCGKARAVRMELDGEYPRFVAKDFDKGSASATLNGSTRMSGSLMAPKRARAKPGRDAYAINMARKAEEKALGGFPSPAAIGLNPDYLTDVCSRLKDERLEVGLWDENSPIRIVLPRDPSFAAVIMPVRL